MADRIFLRKCNQLTEDEFFSLPVERQIKFYENRMFIELKDENGIYNLPLNSPCFPFILEKANDIVEGLFCCHQRNNGCVISFEHDTDCMKFKLIMEIGYTITWKIFITQSFVMVVVLVFILLVIPIWLRFCYDGNIMKTVDIIYFCDNIHL